MEEKSIASYPGLAVHLTNKKTLALLVGGMGRQDFFFSHSLLVFVNRWHPRAMTM